MKLWTGKTVRQEIVGMAINKKNLNPSWKASECVMNLLDGSCAEGTLKDTMKKYFDGLTGKQESRLLKEISDKARKPY